MGSIYYSCFFYLLEEMILLSEIDEKSGSSLPAQLNNVHVFTPPSCLKEKNFVLFLNADTIRKIAFSRAVSGLKKVTFLNADTIRKIAFSRAVSLGSKK